jgi:type IV fimbrial biogenesis protein FimT
MNRENGFTLIELMITLAVLAITLTIAVPGFRDFIMRNQMATNANEFVASIHLARSAAIKQQRNGYITSNAGTNWTNGWTVWVDNDGDNAQDANEVIRVTQALEGDTTLSSNGKTQFQYRPTGLVDGADTLTICDTRTGEQGRQIDISPAGRVNIQAFGGCL